MCYAVGVRPTGSALELEKRRRLAIRRVEDGYTIPEVAKFLEVSERSIERWVHEYLTQGSRGLRSKANPGRIPKLNHLQEKLVKRWLFEPPTDFGFSTDLWTAPRLGLLIEREFGIQFNKNYLSSWLRHKNFTPQIPERNYRETDPEVIQYWVEHHWPRIKKKPIK